MSKIKEHSEKERLIGMNRLLSELGRMVPWIDLWWIEGGNRMHGWSRMWGGVSRRHMHKIV
jgi:hypothetical protein